MKPKFALTSKSLHIPTTTFFLTGGVLTLGRSSKCELIVKHDTVSRRHAELEVTDGAVRVRDLDSRNGTFIENERIRTGGLKKGDHLRFGSVAFELTLAAAGTDSDSDIETAKCSLEGARFDLSHCGLSKAQCRVVTLLLEGLAEKHVASRLHVSSRTVHNHVQAIYRAFQVHSRSELLVRLLKQGQRQQ
jgi:DNA-binding CsgD family transcriptional regulator